MVWGIRNVVHSGILGLLVSAGVDVHLLIRDYDPSLLQAPAYAGFSQAASCSSVLQPPIKRQIKGRSFFRDVIYCAFSRRNGIGSYDLYRRWSERKFGPVQRFRWRAVRFFGKLAQPSPIFSRLYGIHNRMCRMESDLGPVRDQLREIAPDLLWSTVNIEKSFERQYVLAARDLQIPIVNAILSFDNLTSKPTYLFYDHYLVWNQGMKQQLLNLYPRVSDDQIAITGTPQFDFHLRPDFQWSRQKTLENLKLPPDASYFLYTASPRALTPEEPDLVAQIALKMRQRSTLKNCWIVLRTHPLDDWSRWSSVWRSSNRVMLSQAWDSAPDTEGWTLPTLADQARFISSLAHGVACLNIVSTTTLDAAILDRPVIGIRLEDEHNAPREILYEEYDADHYRPLVESGGLRLARNWSELLDLMEQAIRSPERDRAPRARMVEQECGIVDGRAAERVTDALLDCVAKFKQDKLFTVNT